MIGLQNYYLVDNVGFIFNTKGIKGDIYGR